MDKTFLKQIAFHILIGILIFISKIFGILYFIGILGFFFLKIVNSKNKAIYIIAACCYISGAEVLLRMTGSLLFYESCKYLVILLAIVGLFYRGFNLKALPYVFYLVFLVPAIYVSLYSLDVGEDIRKAIAFNLSGPVCLGISALFCAGLKVSQTQMRQLLNYLVLPLISNITYIIFFNPNVAKIANGTSSNFIASGGYGPNQVSTVLGIGMFVFTVRFFLYSKTKWSKLLDVFFIILFSFRAIVTFSRGGVFTAIAMILLFMFFVYISKNAQINKKSILLSILAFVIIATMTWFISSVQTNGNIDKRYQNQNVVGKTKKDVTTGRGDLFLLELEEFNNNPFLGVGVGRIDDIRFQKSGIHAASHNEVSRIISEHGTFGVFAILILLLMPLAIRLYHRNNLFFFPFLAFWFLTINHSSMRIAAPAFLYALALLHVSHEKPIIHRKQVIEKK